jgi:hypothetical protein
MEVAMTGFVEQFALEVAATFAVGAVTAFLFGLSTTHEPAGRPRRAAECPNCGSASRGGAGMRGAA